MTNEEYEIQDRFRENASKIRNVEKREHLCPSCINFIFARGNGLNEEMVQCTAFEKTPRFPVLTCSLYRARNAPSLGAMEEIAYIILPNQDPVRKIGFVSPAEYKRFLERKEKS